MIEFRCSIIGVSEESLHSFSLLRMRNESEVCQGISMDIPTARNSVTMARLPGADCAICVREFHKNGDSMTVTRRNFCSHCGLPNSNDAPTIPFIRV